MPQSSSYAYAERLTDRGCRIVIWTLIWYLKIFLSTEELIFITILITIVITLHRHDPATVTWIIIFRLRHVKYWSSYIWNKDQQIPFNTWRELISRLKYYNTYRYSIRWLGMTIYILYKSRHILIFNKILVDILIASVLNP